MPRVLVSDKLPSAGLDLLRQAGIEIDDRQKLKGDELQEAIRAADGVIVRSDTRITGRRAGESRQAACHRPRRRRRRQHRRGGGDAQGHRRHEHAGRQHRQHRRADDHAVDGAGPAHARRRRQPCAPGKWERSKFVGTQLAGKTLGVVGLGRIGREVARRAAGLDMKILGFDPFLAPAGAPQMGIEPSPISIDCCRAAIS